MDKELFEEKQLNKVYWKYCDCTVAKKYIVTMQPSIDPKYYSGSCFVCGKVHVEKANET